MAQHVNIEESAAHTKQIITITLLQPQLPAPLLSSLQILSLRRGATVAVGGFIFKTGAVKLELFY